MTTCLHNPIGPHTVTHNITVYSTSKPAQGVRRSDEERGDKERWQK